MSYKNIVYVLVCKTLYMVNVVWKYKYVINIEDVLENMKMYVLDFIEFRKNACW